MAVALVGRLLAMAAMAMLLPGALWAAGGGDACPTALQLRSNRVGEQVRVTVRLEVPVPVQLAWEVMTDYGHATRFIRNLRASSVESLAPQRKRVSQLGWVGWSHVGVEVRTVYDVALEPERWRVSGRLVSGDVKSMEMVASLSPVGPARTVLDYTVTTDPGQWVPALLAEGVLRDQARASFEGLAAEMLRRAPACSAFSSGQDIRS
jgi:hypothetical protein